ncbi:MAG: purine-nucleoside phosphorylase [Bacteriovoracales bacterium]|nr:purine-nucleoside phosphorylase [Bacteriovoracales bacterium]
MESLPMYEKILRASQSIQKVCPTKPRVGLVLGSGLGAFGERMKEATSIDYDDIPFFCQTTVEGHKGRLILGHIGDVPTAVLQGRIHAYEGHDMETVVFPVRTLGALGVETLILTNASGGINRSFSPGDLVLINDHINLTGRNPLVGPNMDQLGPRFPDMTRAYHPGLKELFYETAKENRITLKNGIYCSVLGPTYETPAEVHMMAAMGADLVGMSTVAESIAANHLGLKVAGLSCITNMAAGISTENIKHEDVKAQALKVMKPFTDLLEKTIRKC